jgi:ABC-2 type transport system ATP-binding protein
VLEITTDRSQRAVSVLKGRMEHWRVSLFGDRLHVIVDGDAAVAARALEARLARDGIRVLEATAQDYTLEDVFLVIGERRRADAAVAAA